MILELKAVQLTQSGHLCASPSSSLPHLNNSEFYRELNELGEIFYLQLVHDVCTMCFHGAHTNAQGVRYLSCGPSFGEHLEYLPLSVGEFGIQVFLRRFHPLHGDVVLDYPARYGRAQVSIAADRR